MTSNVITQPIVKWDIAKDSPDRTVVTILERAEVITGVTYKTKILEHTYYITINDIIVNEVRRPLEIFINTKDVENFSYLTTITRLISAFFRTGHEYTFIAEELKQIHCPKVSYWKKGKFYPSLIAELGEILEKHCNALNT